MQITVQAYFSASSELHATQAKALLAVCSSMIKKVQDEDEGTAYHHCACDDSKRVVGFGTAPLTGTYRTAAVGMRRAGTLVRSPLEGKKDRKERPEREIQVSDVSNSSPVRQHHIPGT